MYFNLPTCFILFPASPATLATSGPSWLAGWSLFPGWWHKDQEKWAGLNQPSDKPGRSRLDPDAPQQVDFLGPPEAASSPCSHRLQLACKLLPNVDNYSRPNLINT